MSKKLIGIIASFALVLSLVGANTASALTASDIAMLQAAGIINATQAASLTASLSPATTVSSGYTFAKDLTVGSKGADVTALQNMLGVSPATGYFGSLTKAAVIKYQLSKGITPAAGYFGSKTRGIVNGSVTTTTTTTTTTTGTSVVVSGTDLKVSLAPTSPMGGAIINNQAAADMAEFTFTNTSATPAVVTNVSLMRTGVSGDSTLANVYLYNGAVRLTDAATVSSGKISFNAATGLFTVPAGSSIVIAVKADIDTNAAAGQTIAVSLTGVTSNVPVLSVYPVGGAQFTVASAGDIAHITLGTVTNPNASTGAEVSVQAGTLNQTIWSSALAITQRAVYLKSLALKIIGSIPTNSLQNIKLYVAGVQVATSAGIDSNGMLTFDLTAAPYKMDSSRTLEVRADVVNGSTRSFTVSLQNSADLQVVDSNYNVGIAAAGIPASTGSIKVSQGSVSVTLDSTLSSGNLTTGSSNVPLARYAFKAYGEDMKISYLDVQSMDQLDNVALYANGVQIGSTKTISATGSDQTFNIGSSLIIPAGTSQTVEIRGDIKYNGTNATTSNNNTIVVTLTNGYASNAQGSYSQLMSTVPSSSITGPTWTVTGAGLGVAINGNYADQSAIPNTSGVKLGSYILTTTSAEPVRITSLAVGLGGAAGLYTNVSNLYVAPAGSTATTPINPSSSGSNNFSVDFTIAANSSKIVDIYGDLGAQASGVATTTLALSGYGVNSNITISQLAVAGQTLNLGTGSLATPTLDVNASPVSQLVVGGNTTPVSVASYSFVSTTGSSQVQEMYFKVLGPITNLTVGGLSFPVSAGYATATGLTINVPVGYAGLDIPLSATYATIGSNGQASMQVASTSLLGFKYQSGNVSTTTNLVSPVNSLPMVVVASKPTVTMSAAGSYTVSPTAGQYMIGRVTVSADAGGPVTLLKLPLTITTSAAASTTASTIVIKTNGGSTVASTSGSIPAIPQNSSTSSVISFLDANGYRVNPGSPVTFDIYANIEMAYDTNGNPSTITTSITSPSTFVWADANGNYATTTGAYILNFPTAGVAVRNNQ